MSNVIHAPKRRVGGVFSILTYRDSVGNTDSTSESVYSGTVSIGTAPTGGNRRFVFAAFGTVGADNSRTPNSFTIGGAAATTLTTWIDNIGAHGGMWYLEVSSGTTVELIGTLSGNRAQGWISVWTLETGPGGFSILDADSTNATNGALTLTGILEGDHVIAGCALEDGSTAGCSMSNVTQRSEVGGDRGVMIAGDYTLGVGETSWSTTVTNNSSDEATYAAAIRGV